MLAIPIPREDHIKLTLGFGLKVGCKTKRKHDKLITAPGGSLQSQLIDVLGTRHSECITSDVIF
jgi:hypothetical protein